MTLKIRHVFLLMLAELIVVIAACFLVFRYGCTLPASTDEEYPVPTPIMTTQEPKKPETSVLSEDIDIESTPATTDAGETLSVSPTPIGTPEASPTKEPATVKPTAATVRATTEPITPSPTDALITESPTTDEDNETEILP